MLLNQILKKCTGKDQSSDVHWQYETSKSEKELETQIKAVRIYSQDIEMESGLEKRKLKITWIYWKRTPSNKGRWKKKIKKESEKDTRNQTI